MFDYPLTNLLQWGKFASDLCKLRLQAWRWTPPHHQPSYRRETRTINYFFNILTFDEQRRWTKESTLWHKLKYYNPYIFVNWWCKLLIFQIQIIWSNRIHSLKYLRSTTLGFKDIVRIKSEFVAKTLFLWTFSHRYIIARDLSVHPYEIGSRGYCSSLAKRWFCKQGIFIPFFWWCIYSVS